MELKNANTPTQFRVITAIMLLLFIGQKSMAQNPINWTPDQLMNPSDLSTILKENKQVPIIYCVGPDAIIPHSKNIGMIKKEENLKSLKEELANLPKDTQIVIYCGCCPYEHCPNVRPAIQLLKEMKFTNFKLLDLPHNLKADWISKGYPIN
jgi:hypothetical protein